MVITWDSVITLATVIGAFAAILAYYNKMLRWVDRQKDQDEEIKILKEDTAILTYGVLACLKGLKEQGCDGPVTEAIAKIEKHLNQVAHK